MSLRRAKVSDLDALLLIDHEVLKTNWHERLYLEEITNMDSIFNVLVLDTEIIGYILLRRTDSIFEILQLAISKKYQSNGFGSILFEYSLQNLNAESIFLEVSAHNDQAMKFYKKYDFEEIRKRKNYYGSDEDAIVMRKRLI